jgi:biopolymer transport protein ExbB/TolQ
MNWVKSNKLKSAYITALMVVAYYVVPKVMEVVEEYAEGFLVGSMTLLVISASISFAFLRKRLERFNQYASEVFESERDLQILKERHPLSITKSSEAIELEKRIKSLKEKIRQVDEEIENETMGY